MLKLTQFFASLEIEDLIIKRNVWIHSRSFEDRGLQKVQNHTGPVGWVKTFFPFLLPAFCKIHPSNLLKNAKTSFCLRNHTDGMVSLFKGSRIVNVVPFGLFLMAEIDPPWSSTILLHICRPSPAPCSASDLA